MAPEKGSVCLVQVWSGIHDVSTIWKTLGFSNSVENKTFSPVFKQDFTCLATQTK